MSEHKINPTVRLNATLPPLMPPKIDSIVTFSVQVLPQEHVLLVAPENYREDQRLIKDQAGAWQPIPEGVVVHPLGTEMPVELCDAAVVLGTMTRDNLASKVLLPGRPAEPKVSTIAHYPIMRMPLAEYQKEHLAKLRGGVES